MNIPIMLKTQDFETKTRNRTLEKWLFTTQVNLQQKHKAEYKLLNEQLST